MDLKTKMIKDREWVVRLHMPMGTYVLKDFDTEAEAKAYRDNLRQDLKVNSSVGKRFKG